MPTSKLCLVLCLVCLAVALIISVGALAWNLVAFLISAAFLYVLSLVVV